MQATQVIRDRINRRKKRVLTSMTRVPKNQECKPATVVIDLTGSDSEETKKPVPPHSIYYKHNVSQNNTINNIPTAISGGNTWPHSAPSCVPDIPPPAYHVIYRAGEVHSRLAGKQTPRVSRRPEIVATNIDTHAPTNYRACPMHMLNEGTYRAVPDTGILLQTLLLDHHALRSTGLHRKSSKTKYTIVIENVD